MMMMRWDASIGGGKTIWNILVYTRSRSISSLLPFINHQKIVRESSILAVVLLLFSHTSIIDSFVIIFNVIMTKVVEVGSSWNSLLWLYDWQTWLPLYNHYIQSVTVTILVILTVVIIKHYNIITHSKYIYSIVYYALYTYFLNLSSAAARRPQRKRHKFEKYE